MDSGCCPFNNRVNSLKYTGISLTTTEGSFEKCLPMISSLVYPVSSNRDVLQDVNLFIEIFRLAEAESLQTRFTEIRETKEQDIEQLAEI